MLLSLASMNALSSANASSLALADNFGSSSVSRFSPGKCSARSLRRARKTPLCASFVGDGTGGTKASASKLPITEVARRSAVFAGSPIRAPMAGGGIRAPISSPGSEVRCELMSIFGSVPTARMGVRQRPGKSSEACAAWQPPQLASNKGLPFAANCSSSPNISRGHGGGRSTAIFSSSVCSPAKSMELFLKSMIAGASGVGGTRRRGAKSAKTPRTSPVLRPSAWI